MRVAVFGASGVVGQYMQEIEPAYHEIRYYRQTKSGNYESLDLSGEGKDFSLEKIVRTLNEFGPDVIVNLAGQNQVDVVETNPKKYTYINTVIPQELSYWCSDNEARLIQVSTQGVFSGENPPYSPDSYPNPITEYGKQKKEAENWLFSRADCEFSIARLTFVLGIRRDKIGRENPAETILSGRQLSQVSDRWFSPCFAEDAASFLWHFVDRIPDDIIVHIGTPITVSRYDIAKALIPDAPFKEVSHKSFPSLAQRPKDTTWAQGSFCESSFEDGITKLRKEYARIRN